MFCVTIKQLRIKPKLADDGHRFASTVNRCVCVCVLVMFEFNSVHVLSSGVRRALARSLSTSHERRKCHQRVHLSSLQWCRRLLCDANDRPIPFESNLLRVATCLAAAEWIVRSLRSNDDDDDDDDSFIAIRATTCYASSYLQSFSRSSQTSGAEVAEEGGERREEEQYERRNWICLARTCNAMQLVLIRAH